MKRKILLPAIFVVVFALSRIPGLMPSNFSVAYALAFCAGVFFRGPLGWWLPLGVMLLTDLGLNFFYQAKGFTVWDAADLANLAFNYVAYAVLILLGRGFKPTTSFSGLLGGGILGAILFYFITNTASWLFNPFHNPEYTKTLAGWLIALTKGTGGYPSTWEFFRNTLLSGGIFTALFAALGKITSESPAEKNAGAQDGETADESEEQPEEAKT